MLFKDIRETWSFMKYCHEMNKEYNIDYTFWSILKSFLAEDWRHFACKYLGHKWKDLNIEDGEPEDYATPDIWCVRCGKPMSYEAMMEERPDYYEYV
jgi:hypothetical protein